MTDLYETLGVPKGASKEAIRRAYRKKAKTAHPDTGGTVEGFALVKQAHDTLTDDARRARYDETGDAGEGGPDQTESAAMQHAFGAVDHVLAEIDRRYLSYSDIDVVADAIITLKRRLADLDGVIKEADEKIATCKKVAKRFKAKKGKVNHLQQMMDAKQADMERTLAARKFERPPLLRAIDILMDHTYDKTPEPRPAAYNSTKDLQYLLSEAMKPGPIDRTPPNMGWT